MTEFSILHAGLGEKVLGLVVCVLEDLPQSGLLAVFIRQGAFEDKDHHTHPSIRI